MFTVSSTVETKVSRGTVLNTLKQSGINILRGKKPVSGIASLFSGLNEVKRFTKQACRENVVASFFPLEIFSIFLVRAFRNTLIPSVKMTLTMNKMFAGIICQTIQ